MTPANAKALIVSLPRLLAARAASALDAAAVIVADEARSRLQGANGHGAASTLPEVDPPASGDPIATGRDPQGRAAVVTASGLRAVALEYGTAQTPARPFLRPAAAGLAPDVQDSLAAAMGETLRDALRDAR